MELIKYKTVKEFLDENKDILLEKEAINQLILHNAFVNQNETTNKDLLFGRVINNNDICIIFCKVEPYNLLIYLHNSNYINQAVSTLASYLVENNISINGINASKYVCDEFINNYSKLTNKNFKCRFCMDIMELKELNTINVVDGFFRKATLEDLDIIVDFRIKFYKEAVNEDVSSDVVEKSKSDIEEGCMYVFENINHKIVSISKMGRQLINGVCISLVYTDENERGNGYGIAVIYYISKIYLEKDNEFCTLFVDAMNPISNNVYKKVGYKILEDNIDFRIV